MFHRMNVLGLLLALAGGLWFGAGIAEACPMCSQSIAGEDAIPRAYMYSILFMLGMPATVFTGFGIFVYRQVRAHDAAQAVLLADNGSVPTDEEPFAEPLAAPQLALHA